MFLLNIFQIINIFYIIETKNIVLHFKKITIETFSQNKSINDLISYNLYSTIEIGNEQQKVGFFIDQNEASFYLRKRLLSFNSTKSNEIIKIYQSLSNFWFDKQKSVELHNCDYNQFCSETFHFNTYDNKSVNSSGFRFNIYHDFIIERYKCGIIGMKNPSNIYYENNDTYIYFFDELKKNKLIDENYFSILFEDNNNNFDYDHSLYFGKLIIGESPHIFNPEEYQKSDEAVIPGNDYIFLVNTLKFNTSNDFYFESNVEIQISFISGFIKGSNLYRKEIENSFFADLIKKDLCKVEYLNENLYTNDYYIYSCSNNTIVIDKINHFPPLYFEIRPQNITFIFTHKELFKIFKERIYFLIAFRDEYSKYNNKWYVGEIFLRKYFTSFNFDSKSISFYRSQINKANFDSTIIYDEKDLEKKSSIFNIIRTLLEVLMGIFIILMLYIFYRKIRRKRKLHANELEDNNYSYVPKKEEKFILLDKEGSDNK
jgi:hypothetical protein